VKVCIMLGITAFVLSFLCLSGCNSSHQEMRIPLNTSKPVTEKDGWSIFTNNEGINDLIVDGDILWLATSGGVVRWQPEKDEFWKYTTLDGLVSNNVLCLSLGQDGYLWIGTDSGINKFDGSTWTTYYDIGLPTNSIDDIAIDKEGRIWVAGSYYFTTNSDVAQGSGIGCFDGKNWHSFTTRDGLVSNRISSIFVDIQNNIWFSSDDGLSKYDGNQWLSFTTKNSSLPYGKGRFAQDAKGNIWFAVWNGVFRFDGKDWHKYADETELGSSGVSDILIDNRGKIWISTWGDGVLLNSGKHWRKFGEKDGLPGSYAERFTQDNQGNIWCNTKKLIIDQNNQQKLAPTGLARYNGKTWTSYQIPIELPGNDVTAVAVDDNGTAWFSIRNTGVASYDGNAWTLLNTQDGLFRNEVGGIFTDNNGDLWLDFGSVFDRLSEGQRAEQGSGSISKTFNGEIWAVVGTDINRYYDGVWQTTRASANMPIKAPFYGRFSVDKAGKVWVGQGSFLWEFDGKHWFDVSENLPGHIITALYSDNQGNTWVAAQDIESMFIRYRGVTRFDGNTWSFFGFEGIEVRSIYEDSLGFLWFCTGSGLIRFDGTKFYTFKVEHGLASNRVRAISEKEGIYWIATDSGVSRYDTNQAR
jgi:ligand-binding sensor domain-containing protein